MTFFRSWFSLLNGIRPAVREWWSKKSAQWVGVHPDFEEKSVAIRRLRQVCEKIGLDPNRVIQLVRPRFFWYTQGDYGPVSHLISTRFNPALSKHGELEPELHSLLMHSEYGEAARLALLQAVHAYARHIAPKFPYEPAAYRDPALSQNEAVKRMVGLATQKAAGQMLAYLSARNQTSAFLSKTVEAFTRVKKARKKRVGQIPKKK